MSDRIPIGAGVGLLLAGFAGMFWIDRANDTLRADAVTSTIGWFLLAFVGFVVLLRVQVSSLTLQRWRWLLVLGLGLRLLMFVTEPTLSDDVYRYLWEGHLVTEGISPYSFAIDSSLGDAVSIPARDLANNTSLASPYLPVAHGIFGATAAVLPSEPWTMQLLMIGFDMLGAFMMLRLLSAAELPKERLLLYWLNPLVIVEVAHGAHIDAIIIGLASVGLWLTFGRSRTSTFAIYGAPLTIAAATLTRPLTLLFMPVLFWVWTWRQRTAWAIGLATPILLIGVTSGFGFADATGTGVFGSARAYTDTFRFNSSFYHWIEKWIGSQGLDDAGWNDPAALTRLAIAGAVALVLVAVFFAARHPQDARGSMRLLAVPLIAYVLLTPVLHPWYTLLLLWFVPFLTPSTREPLGRWLIAAPWLLLSALLIFSYLTYENPAAFAEREWVRQLEWYPTLALLAGGVLWSVRQAIGQKQQARGERATIAP